MILATSQDVTAIVANGTGTANDLIDYTFDTTFSSDAVAINFDMTCTCSDTVYVGIAGHNIGSKGAKITIINHGVSDIVNFIPIDDRPLMFEIPARTGGSVVVRVVKNNVSDIITVSHVASGSSTDMTSVTDNGQIIQQDYDSGYALAPMALARKSKVTLNEQAAPTATLVKTVSQKMRLNFKDVARSFVSGELITNQIFWVENSFFIQNDNLPGQSYMAMQFLPLTPKAHSTTRSLIDVSYTFTAYNGL